MMRLSLSALDQLPTEVARPAYDVGAVRIGIVHLGIGAFHRAHQAVYVDDRLAAGERSGRSAERACARLRRRMRSARRTGSTRWRSDPDRVSNCG